MKSLAAALTLTSLLTLPAGAQESLSDYAGQEQRTIKSLSSADIAALEQGQGWGLAKPAELNGYPGPRHVLDLGGALQLSAEQQKAVTTLFEQMQRDAKVAGGRYLEAERQLEEGFRDRRINPETLRALVDASARARAELRYVHLTAHLTTLQILTPHQAVTYNRLRGYGDQLNAHPGGHHH